MPGVPGEYRSFLWTPDAKFYAHWHRFKWRRCTLSQIDGRGADVKRGISASHSALTGLANLGKCITLCDLRLQTKGIGEAADCPYAHGFLGIGRGRHAGSSLFRPTASVEAGARPRNPASAHFPAPARSAGHWSSSQVVPSVEILRGLSKLTF